MSTYKFFLTKNNIASASDEHITYDDADGDQDVNVTLNVNGTDIHAVSLTDSGAVLQYTGTLGEGYHTVKITPEAGKPTDVRVDKVSIDDHTVVGSQYLMDTRIFGASFDFFRYKSCVPFRSPKGNDYVWWGDIYNADFTQKSHATHYRPHIVTDLGEWWQWSFSINSNGHLHWECCDTDSLLYDSTENHNYYAAKSTLYNDSATYPQVDASQIPTDSTYGSWLGFGSYDNFLVFYSDEEVEDSTRMTMNSESEWQSAAWYYLNYWPGSNIDPIVTS